MLGEREIKEEGEEREYSGKGLDDKVDLYATANTVRLKNIEEVSFPREDRCRRTSAPRYSYSRVLEQQNKREK